MNQRVLVELIELTQNVMFCMPGLVFLGGGEFRDLLLRWGTSSWCRNVGSGGEGASAGRTHFLYILVGERHGLIRRVAPSNNNDRWP